MSIYVVDASVAAKWFLTEPHTDCALRLLRVGQGLFAPDYFLLEMDNLFCKRIRRGHLTPTRARQVRLVLRRVPIMYAPFAWLQDEAFDIAVRTRRSPYDCLYLALAVRLGGPMVTADRRFFDAVAPGPFAQDVLWVEDVP